MDSGAEPIFPIEDSFLVATRGRRKDPVARGDRGHTGNPGAEKILYAWIDDVLAGRCALLLPVLASLPQPLALLEVGTAAGLGLHPDRYSYRYGDHLLGSGGPVLDCALTGTAPPTRLPEVAWRAGLDLNPLDITNPGDLAWMEALIWPEHSYRRDRLRAAAVIAAAHPPMLARGDLTEELLPLAAQAPAGATLVVFHTSVLYQVPEARRAAFVDLVQELPGHWIAIEAPDVLAYEGLPPPPDQAWHNVLALDGMPLAWTRARRYAAGLDSRSRTGHGVVRVTGETAGAGSSASAPHPPLQVPGDG